MNKNKRYNPHIKSVATISREKQEEKIFEKVERSRSKMSS